MNSLVQVLGLSRPVAQGANLRNLRAAILAGLVIAFGAVYLADGHGWRQALLYLIGTALGVALFHAAFGFTSAWRVFISDRQGAGLRAQMLMLALATLLFLPAQEQGNLFGRPIIGAVAPLSVSLLFGSFLFGVGMQLGGGCGSGTLFSAGGGNSRMWITVIAFIVGSVAATLHVPWWFSQPRISSFSLLVNFGVDGALMIQMAVFAVIVLLTVILERRRHGRLLPSASTDRRGIARFLRGPWALVWGAVALALLNFATLGVAGHPWGITYGFTLWGAKAASAAGIDLSTWEFWTWSYHRRALAGSIFDNSTSVMNMGILMGALFASGLAGRFAPVKPWKLPTRSVLAGRLL